MRPNTPVSGPWMKTNCGNCAGVMWTRDPLSTYEKGGVCDECLYLLTDSLYDQRGKQWQVQRRTFHNPFAR